MHTTEQAAGRSAQPGLLTAAAIGFIAGGAAAGWWWGEAMPGPHPRAEKRYLARQAVAEQLVEQTVFDNVYWVGPHSRYHLDEFDLMLAVDDSLLPPVVVWMQRTRPGDALVDVLDAVEAKVRRESPDVQWERRIFDGTHSTTFRSVRFRGMQSYSPPILSEHEPRLIVVMFTDAERPFVDALVIGDQGRSGRESFLAALLDRWTLGRAGGTGAERQERFRRRATQREAVPADWPRRGKPWEMPPGVLVVWGPTLVLTEEPLQLAQAADRIWRMSMEAYAADIVAGALPGALLGMTAFGAGRFVQHRITERRRRRQGLCSFCGYDLRATPARCPECGAESSHVPRPVNSTR